MVKKETQKWKKHPLLWATVLLGLRKACLLTGPSGCPCLVSASCFFPLHPRSPVHSHCRATRHCVLAIAGKATLLRCCIFSTLCLRCVSPSSVFSLRLVISYSSHISQPPGKLQLLHSSSCPFSTLRKHCVLLFPWIWTHYIQSCLVCCRALFICLGHQWESPAFITGPEHHKHSIFSRGRNEWICVFSFSIYYTAWLHDLGLRAAVSEFAGVTAWVLTQGVCVYVQTQA